MSTRADLEAEIARLRARVRALEAASRATLASATLAAPRRTGPGTIPGVQEMVLLVDDTGTIRFLNPPLARLLDVSDRRAAIGQPLAGLDDTVLGFGTLRAIVDVARGQAQEVVVERPCPALSQDSLPTSHGPRPEGDPILRIVASRQGAQVQLILQDVTRLRWLEETFARFVSPDIIGALERLPTDDHLSMTRRDVTVLFCDLRGFTAVAQRRPPDAVQELVTAFMTLAGEAVDAWGGTAVSWMGDGMMAVFGAPLPTVDHSVRGLACAVDLQRRHRAWAAERTARDLDAPPLGVGVATGETVVGNVGTAARMTYTALGHTTNLAARLCGIAEGGACLTTRQTHQAALAAWPKYAGETPVPRLSFAPRPPTQLKNVDGEVQLVAVTAREAT